MRFYYRNNEWFNGLKNNLKWLLKGLRAAILFFVGLLLFGLILQKNDYRVEKPVIIFLTDRSSSMKNYKDSNLVMNKIIEFQSALNQQLSQDYDLVNMTVGKDVRYASHEYCKLYFIFVFLPIL